MKKFTTKFLLGISLIYQTITPMYGVDYTWSPTPTNGDLNNAANWNPAGGPPSSLDTGTFGVSTITDPFFVSTSVDVGEYIFTGTTPYTLNIESGTSLVMEGEGILNNSSVVQNFNINGTGSNIVFLGTSSADVGSTGLIQYSASTLTSILFNVSSEPGAAKFFLNNATIDFNGVGANAQKANINAQAVSQINFYASYGGGTATVLLDDSTINFSDGNAQSIDITAQNSSTFEVTAPSPATSNCSLNLLTGSIGSNFNDFSMGSLASDATATYNLIGGSSLTVGSNNLSTTFAGSIHDSFGTGGQLIKVGTGTLTLSGTNLYSGLTTVQVGELKLNGSIAGDALVQAGAYLSGVGIVGGNLSMNGIIAPGNSIGTLNVLGNYVQSAGSTYFVQFNGVGQSSLINVGGTATIAGAVNADYIDGQYIANYPYTILHANGGVIGTYTSLTTNVTPNFLVTPTLSYDPNNVYLIFARTLFNLAAATPNQIAVATQLEGIGNPTAEEFLILTTLNSLSVADQQRALDQLSGQQYASFDLEAEIVGRQFVRRLYDPLRSIVTTIPYCDSCDTCTTIDTWFEAGGGQTFIDGNHNARSLKLSGYELTLGVQSTFDVDWTIGIAGTYAEDYAKYDVGGKGRNQTGFGGIYGLYRPSNFYVLGDLLFGGTEFKLDRSISIGTLDFRAKSKPKLYQGLAYIEAGIDYCFCNFLIQPFLGFEGGYFRRDRISEHGLSLFNLNVSKQTYGNAHSRLGVHLTTDQWLDLSLSLDVAWQYRLTSFKRHITEQFQSFGTPFIISGVPYNRSSVDAALTFTTKLCGGWELYAEVGGEFWSKAGTYNALGGVKYSW